MDLDSINGGTVDTKSWFNPVVGTLRAKKIICDDIEGGGGGGGGTLALNSAVNPSTFSDTVDGSTFIGGVNGYSPVSRLIPTADLYVANSSFVFEASGTLVSRVTSAGGLSNSSRPSFGIMIGDDYTTAANVLGYTAINIDNALFSPQELVWTYKLVATHVASATIGGFALAWSSEISRALSKNNNFIGSAGIISRIGMGTKDFGLLPVVSGGARCSMYVSNLDFDGTATMTVVKYNHTFKRVA